MSKLKFIKGNIFDSKTESIVCPVNCVGVLGAGLAKDFRDNPKFKYTNEQYQLMCKEGQMAPGSICTSFFVDDNKKDMECVFYMATKNHWRHDSKLEWIEIGLFNLLKALNAFSLSSVALPAVGSGNGHLPWPSVEMLIKNIFENDGNRERVVEIYLPLDKDLRH